MPACTSCGPPAAPAMRCRPPAPSVAGMLACAVFIHTIPTLNRPLDSALQRRRDRAPVPVPVASTTGAGMGNVRDVACQGQWMLETWSLQHDRDNHGGIVPTAMTQDKHGGLFLDRSRIGTVREDAPRLPLP